jgi:hypothetical protein
MVAKPEPYAVVMAAAKAALASPAEGFPSVWRVKLHSSPGVVPERTCRNRAMVYLLDVEEPELLRALTVMVAPLSSPERTDAVGALAP